MDKFMFEIHKFFCVQLYCCISTCDLSSQFYTYSTDLFDVCESISLLCENIASATRSITRL